MPVPELHGTGSRVDKDDFILGWMHMRGYALVRCNRLGDHYESRRPRRDRIDLDRESRDAPYASHSPLAFVFFQNERYLSVSRSRNPGLTWYGRVGTGEGPIDCQQDRSEGPREMTHGELG